MKLQEKELRGVSTNDQGIVSAVSPGGAINHTLLAAAASLDPPRRLMLTVAANESARTWTIEGRDRYGNVVTEQIVGPGAAGTTLTTWEYMSVSRIAVNGATAGSVRWGWNNEFYSQWFPLEDYRTPFNFGFGVEVFGTCNYTVQHCRQPNIRLNGALGHNDVRAMVFDHPSIAGKTERAEGNYSFPISAVRVKLNSVTNGDGILFRGKQSWR